MAEEVIWFAVFVFMVTVTTYAASKNIRWLVVVLASIFLLTQFDLMLIGLDSVGRTVAREVINSGVAVREKLDAIQKIHYAQFPMRLITFLCGIGLSILAIIRPRSVKSVEIENREK